MVVPGVLADERRAISEAHAGLYCVVLLTSTKQRAQALTSTYPFGANMRAAVRIPRTCGVFGRFHEKDDDDAANPEQFKTVTV